MYFSSITISENTTTLQEYSLHMKNTNLTIHPDLYIQKNISQVQYGYTPILS